MAAATTKKATNNRVQNKPQRTVHEHVVPSSWDSEWEDEHFIYAGVARRDKRTLAVLKRQGYEEAPDHPNADEDLVVIRIAKEVKQANYDQACGNLIGMLDRDAREEHTDDGYGNGVYKSTSKRRPESFGELIQRLPDESEVNAEKTLARADEVDES